MCEAHDARFIKVGVLSYGAGVPGRCVTPSGSVQTQVWSAGSPSGPTVTWRPSSSWSSSGKSRRRWAPRLSWRASAQSAISRTSGCGSALSARRPSRSRSSPALRPQRLAAGGGRDWGADPVAARGAGGNRRPAGGLGERRARRAGAEHEALGERVGGEPVGAVQAGAGALADRVQARERGPPVDVGGDPAHHVVGGRRDRHKLALGVDPGLAQRADDVGEQRRVDRRACRDRRRWRPSSPSGAALPGRPRRAAPARRRTARRRR